MRSIIFGALLVIAGSLNVFAQEQGLFGDDNQPGNRLHQAITTNMEKGVEEQTAVSDAIAVSLTEESVILDTASKSAVAFNIELAELFFVNMVSTNSLIEVTKILIEENSDAAAQVVTLGSYLYPDFAQEVIDGAALTGMMSAEDAFSIALAANVDPTSISVATAAAAGPTVTAPIGAGIGGGGAGGGDTTASTN